MGWQPLPTGSRGEPRRIAHGLERVVAHLGAPRVEVLRAVFDRWEDLVGPAIAERAQPLRIDRGRLIVVVDDPAWATQLRWLAPDLLARVRDHGAADGAAGVESIEVVVRATGSKRGRPTRP